MSVKPPAPIKPITAAVVDYGAGNVASVAATLQRLGYRCRVTHDTETLAAADVMVLPGVGAFPAAMEALHRLRLVEFIQAQARRGQPLVGICLGMQLLADASDEFRLTAGLGLVPGHVRALSSGAHIGWNTLEVLGRDPLLQASDRQWLYFNHSYAFDVPAEYCSGVSRVHTDSAFTATVRRGSIVGLQFHPEKSQDAGRALLKNVIEGLCRDQ